MKLNDFQQAFPAELAGLRRAYAEPHRAYHDWRHIEALMEQLARHRAQVRNPESTLLAVLYHDCIYDPLSKTNERDSAARMCAELAGRVVDPVLGAAKALILATETHTMPPDLESDLAASLASDCALFLDMDLAILGADRAAYDRYEAAIRREFAVVPDEAYRIGRKAVLSRFLERDRLYFTDAYRASHEASARANLARAITEL